MMLIHPKKAAAFVPKEYRPISWLRLLSLLAFAAACGILLGAIYFVYNNVYVIVGSVDSILTLQSDLKIEAIDFTRLDRVTASWNERNAQTIIILPRDPFYTTATSTVASPAPTITIDQ